MNDGRAVGGSRCQQNDVPCKSGAGNGRERAACRDPFQPRPAWVQIPQEGLLLLLGVDHFLDMARSATNVLGNGIACAVVAQWEGNLGEQDPELGLAEAAVRPPERA